MNPLLAAVADVLFPASCGSCRAMLPHQALLCDRCQDSATEVTAPMCDRCGLPSIQSTCVDCAELDDASQSFDRARALYVYRGPVEKALLRAKFGDAPAVCEAAGEEMGQALLSGRVEGLDRNPDGVCWVPVGRRRLARRGYDQSALIAERVARVLQRPLLRHKVKRHRETSAQAQQDRHARARNVCDAFSFCTSTSVADHNILLIDDLVTTGHTAQAAAAALKRAGAKRVEVLSLARASFGGV